MHYLEYKKFLPGKLYSIYSKHIAHCLRKGILNRDSHKPRVQSTHFARTKPIPTF
jgi:hypothetical protein